MLLLIDYDWDGIQEMSLLEDLIMLQELQLMVMFILHIILRRCTVHHISKVLFI